ERRAVDEVGRVEAHVLLPDEVVHRGEARVIEAAQRPELRAQAIEGARVGQEIDRQLAIEQAVAHRVRSGQPSAPARAEDLVAAREHVTGGEDASTLRWSACWSNLEHYGAHPSRLTPDPRLAPGLLSPAGWEDIMSRRAYGWLCVVVVAGCVPAGAPL